MGKGWKAFKLEAELRKKLKKPVRVANDADVQGLGCVTGHGDELVITLGTGFGSVLFVDGHRIHLELGHHPFRNGKTYEDELGIKAFLKKGKKKWNKHLREAIDELAKTFNYDRLYIGGGNAATINFKLPSNVKASQQYRRPARRHQAVAGSSDGEESCVRRQPAANVAPQSRMR